MDLEQPLAVALVASLADNEVFSGEAEAGAGSNATKTVARTNYGLDKRCNSVQIASGVFIKTLISFFGVSTGIFFP